MGTEITQVLQGRLRTIDGPTVFFLRKILRVTRLDVPEVCSSISQLELKRRRSCVEDGLVLAVIGRCALVARLGKQCLPLQFWLLIIMRWQVYHFGGLAGKGVRF